MRVHPRGQGAGVVSQAGIELLYRSARAELGRLVVRTDTAACTHAFLQLLTPTADQRPGKINSPGAGPHMER